MLPRPAVKEKLNLTQAKTPVLKKMPKNDPYIDMECRNVTEFNCIQLDPLTTSFLFNETFNESFSFDKRNCNKFNQYYKCVQVKFPTKCRDKYESTFRKFNQINESCEPKVKYCFNQSNQIHEYATTKGYFILFYFGLMIVKHF